LIVPPQQLRQTLPRPGKMVVEVTDFRISLRQAVGDLDHSLGMSNGLRHVALLLEDPRQRRQAVAPLQHISLPLRKVVYQTRQQAIGIFKVLDRFVEFSGVRQKRRKARFAPRQIGLELPVFRNLGVGPLSPYDGLAASLLRQRRHPFTLE
jgi:hypothetical protein